MKRKEIDFMTILQSGIKINIEKEDFVYWKHRMKPLFVTLWHNTILRCTGV